MSKSRQSKIMSFIKGKLFYKAVAKTTKVNLDIIEDSVKQTSKAVKNLRKMEGDFNWLDKKDKSNK